MYTVKTWEHEQSENVTWRVFHTLGGAYKFAKMADSTKRKSSVIATR